MGLGYLHQSPFFRRCERPVEWPELHSKRCVRDKLTRSSGWPASMANKGQRDSIEIRSPCLPLSNRHESDPSRHPISHDKGAMSRVICIPGLELAEPGHSRHFEDTSGLPVTRPVFETSQRKKCRSPQPDRFYSAGLRGAVAPFQVAWFQGSSPAYPQSQSAKRN
jgi:hypothetical protein